MGVWKLEKLSQYGIDLTGKVDKSTGRYVLMEEITKRKELEDEARDILSAALNNALIRTFPPIVSTKFTDLTFVHDYLTSIINKEIKDPLIQECIKELKSQDIPYKGTFPHYLPYQGISTKMDGFDIELGGGIKISVYTVPYADYKKKHWNLNGYQSI